MSRVSESDPRGQHPNILAFDPHADGEPGATAPAVPDDDLHDDLHDDDTVLAPDDGDDNPPAGAAALAVPLVIRAPRGPLPVVPGYTVAAVSLDLDDVQEETFDAFQFLTSKKLANERMARGLCHLKSLHPEQIPEEFTHLVVHDHTGQEVYRRPILRAA